jgi:hypothetical protein
LCWISLLSRVGVVVNNLWEILFLTHRARFVRRALEIESRRTTPRSSEYAERASVCAGASSAPRKTRKSGNKIDQAKLGYEISRQSRRQERPTTLASNPTNRTQTKRTLKTTNPVHRGRVQHPAALILPLVAWVVRRHARQERLIWLFCFARRPPYPRPEGPLAGRELRSLIRRNRS